MKRGDKVWVCQDGKLSRRVPGVVVRQHNGHHISVEFEYSRDEGPLVAKFRKTGKRRFGGWAEVVCFMPWFSVHKRKDTP